MSTSDGQIVACHHEAELAAAPAPDAPPAATATRQAGSHHPARPAAAADQGHPGPIAGSRRRWHRGPARRRCSAMWWCTGPAQGTRGRSTATKRRAASAWGEGSRHQGSKVRTARVPGAAADGGTRARSALRRSSVTPRKRLRANDHAIAPAPAPGASRRPRHLVDNCAPHVASLRSFALVATAREASSACRSCRVRWPRECCCSASSATAC